MIVYTKERGNLDEYILDHEKRTVTFKNGDFLVSVSVAIFTEQDEKLIISRYNDFKRIFDAELTTLYRNGRWEGIKYFLRKVLNNRNFVFSITNKSFILAKILFFSLVGRQAYISRPGYSLSFISDLARMKDDLTYPMLFTCRRDNTANYKVLLKVPLNCPYYLTDFHNFFKREVQHIYWSNNYEKYLAELTKYNLQDMRTFDQYITGFDFANLVERFTSGLKNADIASVKFVRDDEYEYHKDVKFELGFTHANIEYVKNKKDYPILHMLDDFSKFFHLLITDCFRILDNNLSYDNEQFNLLAHIFILGRQDNIEFQMSTANWASLVGIVDLCNETISPFYKQNRFVDKVILDQYTRVNEYLKNHFDDKRAFSVFKNRV